MRGVAGRQTQGPMLKTKLSLWKPKGLLEQIADECTGSKSLRNEIASTMQELKGIRNRYSSGTLGVMAAGLKIEPRSGILKAEYRQVDVVTGAC